MQKVELDRIGKKPIYAEIPDNCTKFIDMKAELTFGRMYDTVSKRWVNPKVKYFVYWEKNDKGKWILHNEPLEELIRMGYLDRKALQESIVKAKTEGIYSLKSDG